MVCAVDPTALIRLEATLGTRRGHKARVDCGGAKRGSGAPHERPLSLARSRPHERPLSLVRSRPHDGRGPTLCDGGRSVRRRARPPALLGQSPCTGSRGT
jgi:hypothetical protein